LTPLRSTQPPPKIRLSSPTPWQSLQIRRYILDGGHDQSHI
jgi:hypothetical protein